MSSRIFRAALAAGFVSFGLVGLALAAPKPPTPPAAPDAPRVEKRVMVMRGGPDGPRRFHRDPEAHAGHLRDILQLTSAQEPALQAFLDGTRPQWERREKPDADAPGLQSTPLTTPERLDRQAEMMARHRAAFEKRAAAIKTFYAQLNPAQRRAFDALHLDGPGGPRHRVFRHGPGEGPMAFGPEDDILLGALDGAPFDIEAFDLELPPMPPADIMPPPPPAPPRTPDA